MNNPYDPPGSPPQGQPPGVAPQPGVAPAPVMAPPPGAVPGYAPPGAMQPGYPQPGYPQPGYPPPGYPQPAAAPFTGQPKTHGLAILGLVLAFIAPCAMIGIVLSIVSMIQINNSHGALTGKGLSIAGIVVGALMFLVMMIGSALMPILVRM